MTLKNNRAPLLYYIKLCVTFQSHCYIQTGVTIWKRSIQAKIGNFFVPCDLAIDRWPWETTEHLSYAASSFVHHIILKPLVHSNWSYSPEAPNIGQNRQYFLAVWPWNLTDDLEKQQGISCKQHQALCIISSLYVNQTGVTIRKLLNGVMTSVTLIIDLWHGAFAWTSYLSMVITPENFMMIKWREHSQKRVTDGQMDWQTNRRMDWAIHRAARSQLKMWKIKFK